MITAHLKATVKLIAGNHLGFTHKDVYVQSLRAAGAMAFICSDVDTDIISLIEHWRSDEMLRYLHVQAEPIMRNYSKLMISHGNYTKLGPYLLILFRNCFFFTTHPAFDVSTPPRWLMAYGETRPLLSAY